MLMENYIYTEATINKSLNSGAWETDKNGNPIVIIEASNENLDYEGEKVLRSALLNSKEYFLKNGVISFDHKHLPSPDNYQYDPQWNAEKYILGKPLDAWEGKDRSGNPVVMVKAVLSKSNDIAKEIIKKLQDGLETVKASVGGRKVKKSVTVDTSTYSDVPTIMGVDWDEVALTYKPVNQTLGATVLSPREFVKSLTAGNSVNPGQMTGGNCLQVQSLEREGISSLLEKIGKQEIRKSEQAISHLGNFGFSQERAGKLLDLIINQDIIGDVVMNKGQNDFIDTATDELSKALAELDGNKDLLSKAIEDLEDGESIVKKGGHSYIKKADGSMDKVDPDSPDYGDDDDDLDDEDMGKSIEDDGYIDVTNEFNDMKKSVRSLERMVKSLEGTIEKQNTVLKSMGSLAMQDSGLIKSIANAPLPRKSQNGVVVQPRFQKSQVDSIAKMDAVTMQKSLREAGINENVIALADTAHRRAGMAGVAQACPDVLPILMKEEN